jgi:hypothetical protein
MEQNGSSIAKRLHSVSRTVRGIAQELQDEQHTHHQHHFTVARLQKEIDAVADAFSEAEEEFLSTPLDLDTISDEEADSLNTMSVATLELKDLGNRAQVGLQNTALFRRLRQK